MTKVARLYYMVAVREWEDGAKGSGDWKPYDAPTAAKLSATLAAGSLSPTMKFGSSDYDIDLAMMTQKKQATGFVRAMRVGCADSAEAYTLSTRSLLRRAVPSAEPASPPPDRKSPVTARHVLVIITVLVRGTAVSPIALRTIVVLQSL